MNYGRRTYRDHYGARVYVPQSGMEVERAFSATVQEESAIRANEVRVAFDALRQEMAEDAVAFHEGERVQNTLTGDFGYVREVTGHNQVRLADGKTYSPTVLVKVPISKRTRHPSKKA